MISGLSLNSILFREILFRSAAKAAADAMNPIGFSESYKLIAN